MTPLTRLALACLVIGVVTRDVQWIGAVLPLAFVLGRKSAIRTNGVHMIRTGSHRLATGRW